MIIPFLNAQRFIVETLESVLAQDFPDWELLLVDDGSTDGSTAIAKDYERKMPSRIRYLDHPGHANLGLCASRNAGVRSARGELLALLDSDDCWVPTKLREQVDILDRFPDVDCVAGTTRYWRSWEGGEDRLVPSGHVQNRPIAPPEALLEVYPLGRGAAPCPSDLLVRRCAVLAIGGFEESFHGPLALYEDQAFLTKFYLRHAIYFSDKHWLDYRLHDQSIMGQSTRAGDKLQVRRYFLGWLKRYLEASGYGKDRNIHRALSRALWRNRKDRLRATLRKVRQRLRSR